MKSGTNSGRNICEWSRANEILVLNLKKNDTKIAPPKLRIGGIHECGG